jgi:hypothetical protein
MSPPSIRGPPAPDVFFLTGRDNRKPGPNRSTGRFFRGRLYRGWQKAVTRTFDWIDQKFKEVDH